MFCTVCGVKLGGVAHVVNNELLCETCFLKFEQNQQKINATPEQHTVFMGQVSEDERTTASESIPNESVPEVNIPQNLTQTPNSPPTAPQQPQPAFARPPYMLSSEQILWKRTFSKGIIHREATLTEVITNQRALCIDDQQNRIVRAAPLEEAKIAVTNTRRDYSSVHTGFERYGAYSGVSKGSGVTIGNLDFFIQGRIVLTLSNIRDPFGLKRLIDNSVKSTREGLR